MNRNFSDMVTEEERAIRERCFVIWTKMNKVGYKTFRGRQLQAERERLKARLNELVDQRYALDGRREKR